MLGKIKTHFGLEILIQINANSFIRTKNKRGLELAVGDHVEIENDQILKFKRSNELQRKISSHRIQTIAANLSHVGIVISSLPETPIFFIDQVIVACRYYSIKPILIVTKLDLPNSERFLEKIKKIYANSLQICAPFCINSLSRPFRIIFIGVSGSGKSTLINKFIPDANQKIGKLNNKMFGNHTTSRSILFDLFYDGEIIDTPGIRDFLISNILANEISNYFPGFEDIDLQCKYKNCAHQFEPECSVKKKVSREIYRRYLEMYLSYC